MSQAPVGKAQQTCAAHMVYILGTFFFTRWRPKLTLSYRSVYRKAEYRSYRVRSDPLIGFSSWRYDSRSRLAVNGRPAPGNRVAL